MQADLFCPDAPGFKGGATSFAAAEAVKESAASIRLMVVNALRRAPGTPEQICARIARKSVTLTSVRSRCSELSRSGVIRDSGRRGRSQAGVAAKVWELIP